MEPLIKEPPDVDLPDPEQYSGWYGETWIKYPLNQTLCPVQFGQLFKAKAEFCVILNRLGSNLFKDDKISATGLSTKETTDFANEFSTWYAALPSPLTPENIVFPAQLKLQ